MRLFPAAGALGSLLFSTSIASAQIGTCPDEWGAFMGQVAEIRQTAESYEESPFQAACKEPPGLLKDRPATGLFRRAVPERDTKGNTAREFLKKVMGKVKNRVEESENLARNIRVCLKPDAPRGCAPLQKWLREELPSYVNEARYHLALGQSQREFGTWLGRTSTELNDDLDGLGSYKEIPWTPLTEDEKRLPAADLQTYRQEIRAEATRRLQSGELNRQTTRRFVDESLLAVRFQHYQTYYQMLAEVPLMQHLRGPGAGEKDILEALDRMEEQLRAEKNFLRSKERLLNRPGELDPEVLQMMNYNSFVEETLLESPGECGLATSLLYTSSNRELGNALAIGLPVMAISIFAPPLAGFAIGAAAGGGFALHSHLEYRQARARALSHVYGDRVGRPEGVLPSDLPQLEASYRQRNYDLVTLPVGMGLGSVATRALVVRSGALGAARQLFTRVQARRGSGGT